MRINSNTVRNALLSTDLDLMCNGIGRPHSYGLFRKYEGVLLVLKTGGTQMV